MEHVNLCGILWYIHTSPSRRNNKNKKMMLNFKYFWMEEKLVHVHNR